MRLHETSDQKTLHPLMRACATAAGARGWVVGRVHGEHDRGEAKMSLTRGDEDLIMLSSEVGVGRITATCFLDSQPSYNVRDVAGFERVLDAVYGNAPLPDSAVQLGVRVVGRNGLLATPGSHARRPVDLPNFRRLCDVVLAVVSMLRSRDVEPTVGLITTRSFRIDVPGSDDHWEVYVSSDGVLALSDCMGENMQEVESPAEIYMEIVGSVRRRRPRPVTEAAVDLGAELVKRGWKRAAGTTVMRGPNGIKIVFGDRYVKVTDLRVKSNDKMIAYLHIERMLEVVDAIARDSRIVRPSVAATKLGVRVEDGLIFLPVHGTYNACAPVRTYNDFTGDVDNLEAVGRDAAFVLELMALIRVDTEVSLCAEWGFGLCGVQWVLDMQDSLQVLVSSRRDASPRCEIRTIEEEDVVVETDDPHAVRAALMRTKAYRGIVG